MKNKLFLGKEVSVFVDGGWSFSGKVISDKKSYILLLDPQEEVSLIYKSKISCITMTKTEISKEVESLQEKKESTSQSNFVVFKPGTTRKKDEEKKVSDSNDDLSEGGLSLPQEVLLSSSEFTTRKKDWPKKAFSDDDDFSISLSSLRGKNNLSAGGSDDRK